MNSNEFNSKYRLSKDFQQKIHLSNRKNSGNSVAGKPKVLWIEILKRFFSNPSVIVASIVFLALIITAIVVYYTSPYIASDRVDATWINKTSNINNLPPQYSPYKVVERTNDVVKTLQEMKSGEYSAYLKDYAVYDFANADRTQIAYDAYKFRYGAHLLSEFKKWRLNNPNETLNASIVQQIQSTMTELKTWLGTTAKGQDVWTTAWVGTLQSMKIALIVASVEIIIGVAVGSYLGFHAGKWLDTLMMRVIEIFVSPPSIIWLLLFVSIWGTNDWVLISGLLFVGWTSPIGATRMFIITVKDEEYITAAKSIGASTPRQIYLHALPAIMGKLAMIFVRRIPSVILSVASLAFLGFFKDEKSSNLGKFMLDNLGDSQENSWLLLLPTLILLTLSLSLQFIAIGLHDALDPRVVKSKGH